MSATLEGQAYGLRVTEVRPGINDTHFSNQPGQPEADAALDPLHVADVIVQAIAMPWSLRVDEIALHPAGQDVAF